MIIAGAEDPALLIYAIGKNVERAESLSKITDPVKFAFTVAKMEKDIKVSKSNKRTPPAPERKVTGSAQRSGSGDRQLQIARDKAAKTGDYTDVIRLKRKLNK
jgi:hypothetical protein